MKPKRLVLLSYIAAALIASPALSALPQRQTVSRPSGTTVRSGKMATTAMVRSSPTTVRSGRMGTRTVGRSARKTVRGRMGTTFRNRTFNNNDFVFFDMFGVPSYYPYAYYYPYYDYGYAYRYSYYDSYYSGLGSDYNAVAAVQRRLGELGYYHGVVDGIMGPGTRATIAAYESTHGLFVDGRISGSLLDRLGLS